MGFVGALLVGCALMAAAFSAAAQTEAAASQARAPERLIVTAERRPVDAAAEPSNVSVWDFETLTRLSADHPQEALNRAPGVFLHRGSGQEHLTAIRSPVLTGGAGAGSFLYLQDGVPLRAAGFANVNGLFEAPTEFAAGLETVRGPGSALYGSNAVHGLVNVLTPAPQHTQTRVSASLSTLQRTKAQLVRSHGDANGGVLFGVDLLNDNGWREPSGVDQQKVLARWDVRRPGFSAQTSATFTNLQQETAGFEQGDDAYRDEEAVRSNEFPQAYRDAQSARLQSRLSWDLAAGGTIALTPYARWTQMEFLQHFLPSQGVEDNGHWSVGALATMYAEPAPQLQLAGGVDVEVTRGFLQEFQPLTAEELTLPSFLADDFPQGVHYDYAIEALTAAAYGEAEWVFAPRWILEAGLRAEAVRYAYDTQVVGDVGRFRRPDDRADDFLTLTPKLAVLRRFTGGQSAYLRYARGARAPQTTDLYRLQTGQDPAAADPETLDSIELGWRGEVGPVFLDLAAFWMEKRNFFFRDADGLNVTDGVTRHQGVEAALRWTIAPQLSAQASASYARHTYEFDRPANGIVSGADIDTAPRWLAQATLLWTPDPFEAELEWMFVDDYFTDPANTQSYPGHQVFNVRGAWAAADGVQIFAILRNMADEDYADRADFAFGNERYFPGEPRSVTLGLRTQF